MLSRLRCGWWELLGLVEDVEVEVVWVVMEEEGVDVELEVVEV